jgi:1,4-alpha-glucan branching enzyme
MTHALIDRDDLLAPFAPVIEGRRVRLEEAERRFAGDARRLSDRCNSHLYYGLHRCTSGWVFREWAPNATEIFLLGPFNEWRRCTEHALHRVNGEGDWEIYLPASTLAHGMPYRLLVEWDGGCGERLPTHVRRAVQDEYTKVFSAEVWAPLDPYRMRTKALKNTSAPLVYEAHVGMSTEHRRVSTFTEFRLFVLPRVVDLGYNVLQLMGVQEHPYYGSFGYQVSNFFAVSSRLGTPDDLKQLVDAAHGMDIRVVMDLVHSHAVCNEEEGLSCFDGRSDQFFHSGERGWHPLWHSRCFDYGKVQVVHFLLSNCKFWLEEFGLDGFRFDGITSMVYRDHGIGRTFSGYAPYFDGNQDEDALTYLGLANKVVHQVTPSAITIAEEVSGMPGMAFPTEKGGIGFDFRMSMGVPDYWIRLVKERRDEDWHMGDLFHELTNKRAEERSISYVESHDQALVGDKTMFFRLVDSQLYEQMSITTRNAAIDRGMMLHKMIRLVTLATAGDGYLTFMGNEWGHPEWIDFPREGNGWSYEHARRLWSLVDNEHLRYRFLNAFDRAMVQLANKPGFFDCRPDPLTRDNERQVLAFARGNLLFAFNFNPTRSLEGYLLDAPPGRYRLVLCTDSPEFDGFGRVDKSVEYFTHHTSPGRSQLQLYLPARSALALERS